MGGLTATATCKYNSVTSYIPFAPIVIGSHWTDAEGNRINKALVTDTVQLHLQTREADGKRLMVSIFDANPILDTELFEDIEVTISGNQAVVNIKLEERLGKYVKDDWGNELELYCRCYFEGSDTVFRIGRSSSQYLLVYEAGYYRDDRCRVIVNVTNGEIHWVPENCHRLTRNAHYNFVQNPQNWTWRGTQQDVGVKDATLLGLWAFYRGEVDSRTVFTRYHKNSAEATYFTLNSRDDSPTVDDRRLKIGVVIAKSTGMPDRRIRSERTMVTAGNSNMRVAGAYGALAIQAVIVTLDTLPLAAFWRDERLIKQHFETLLSEVQDDIFLYLSNHLLPDHINNLETYFLLSNFILCGKRDGMSDELFEIGKYIYRNYSEFAKK
jgi:hypothetical protein